MIVVREYPKFHKGTKVKHLSNQDITMVATKLVTERKRVKTAFGNSFNFQTKHSFFEGFYVCEWIDTRGKHTEVFHQDMLVQIE